MVIRTVAAAVVCVGMLAGCSGTGSGAKADISQISSIKASFGPQFSVTEVAPTGIDPRLLSGQIDVEVLPEPALSKS